MNRVFFKRFNIESGETCLWRGKKAFCPNYNIGERNWGHHHRRFSLLSALPLFLICLGHRSRRFLFRPINSTHHKNGTFGEFLHHTK